MLYTQKKQITQLGDSIRRQCIFSTGFFLTFPLKTLFEENFAACRSFCCCVHEIAGLKKTDAGALSPAVIFRHSEVLDTFKPVTKWLKTVWGKKMPFVV